MKAEQLLEALEAAAEKLEIKIRNEALGPSGAVGGGGLCKVRGEWWLIVDRKMNPHDKMGVIAEALADFDLTEVELPEKARAMVEARRALRPHTSPGETAAGG